MVLPSIILVFIFFYIPMYGVLIAFQDYRPQYGIFGSEWVGLAHFKAFFQSPHSWNIVRNTLVMGVYGFVASTPAPIILALALNEVQHNKFKRVVQTVTYIPYFISVVVVCGMVRSIFAYDGPINAIIHQLGGTPIGFLSDPALFPSMIVWSGIWQYVGWNSIIYLAVLTNIDPALYEAAHIDGCGRLRQMWHVSIPGIVPTIVIGVIMGAGGILGSDTSKILLLYTPLTYETGDVIGTFVYRRGLQGGDFSYSEAISLMETAIAFCMTVFVNWLSRKTTETSLW